MLGDYAGFAEAGAPFLPTIRNSRGAIASTSLWSSSSSRLRVSTTHHRSFPDDDDAAAHAGVMAHTHTGALAGARRTIVDCRRRVRRAPCDANLDVNQTITTFSEIVIIVWVHAWWTGGKTSAPTTTTQTTSTAASKCICVECTFKYAACLILWVF